MPTNEKRHENDLRHESRASSSQSDSDSPSPPPVAGKAPEQVMPSSPESSPESSTSSLETDSRMLWLIPVLEFFSNHFAWVSNNAKWSKVKPVIRCAAAAWVSAVLFVIPAFEAAVGQASFLVLIAAFLSPPSDPFMSVLERETLILLFVTTAWAWACLGIFLANLARHVRNPAATFLDAVTGQYIEAAPTIIMAIFIFFGSAFFLYIKVRQGPGPYTFACVFACICLDITLTTAALFPYPFYLIGRSIAAPLACHSAIALLASVLVFPSTLSALFTTRLSGVMAPALTAITLHRKLLSKPISSPSFNADLVSMRTATKQVEGAIVPLAAAGRLLKSDLIYGRFAPEDFRVFQQIIRRLAGRADGLSVYWALVDPARERFPGTANPTPAGTVPGTPRRSMQQSRAASRAGSPERRDTDADGALHPEMTRTESAGGSISRLRSHGTGTTHSHPHTHGRSVHSVGHAHMHLHSPLGAHAHHHAGQQHHHLLHSSLMSLARSRARARKPEYAVGIFESQRYLNLEMTRLHDPHEEVYTEQTVRLLKESCDPLLKACHLGGSTVQTWLGTVRDGRISYLFGLKRDEYKKRQEDRLTEVKAVRQKLNDELEKFRAITRHAILLPYRPAFDEEGHQTLPAHSTSTSIPLTRLTSYDTPVHSGLAFGQLDNWQDDQPAHASDKDKESKATEDHDEGHDEYAMPPHRYLFYCYVYHYNLIQIASIMIEMLDEIIRLEQERPVCKLWTPVQHIFLWNPWLIPEHVEEIEDDEDPNLIKGLRNPRQGTDTPPDSPLSNGYQSHTHTHADLGLPKRRDPEALPPQNMFEVVLRFLYRFSMALGSGNAMFSLKAGLLTVILCLPSFIKNSAAFAYENRFVWAIFMGQLTIARFRGETTFGLTARITSTFFGGVTGMVMWYISCGSGRGNAFGLAAVCLVCFPFFFFARLYWPIPPMSNIVFFVTSVLVIGYSYQDLHIVLPGAPGFGFSVFWKRFTLVTVGVVAAFIGSFLPPSTTIRRYQRHMLATTIAEMGNIYCDILSFANTKHEAEVQDIVSSLLAVRNKLGKSAALNTNIIYEFSLRGRWPAKRYQRIADLQMALSYSLSHLMSVLEHLEPSWSRAFLQRTRFMDPAFQGDILAVISMISLSLRTGTPLPQITPCPLIDRFTLKYHGLDVIHKDSEEDYGLPRTLSLDTLKNEQYLMFSVGISTAYGVINRLDRLMLAVKEVVGEQYHIHGVGLAPPMQMNNLDFGGIPNGQGTSLRGTSLRGTSIKGNGVELGERTNTVHFD